MFKQWPTLAYQCSTRWSKGLPFLLFKLLVSMLATCTTWGAYTTLAQAQSSCVDNPQYAFCCDPTIDICVPRTSTIKYGVTAGDLCVNGYPAPQSCNGVFSWLANFSSPDESIEWRKGFISKYWGDIEQAWTSSGAYDQCAPLAIEPDDGSWSGPEQSLTLANSQWQGWNTIVFHKGTPPNGGNVTCNDPRPLPQHFIVLRYLVEDDCEDGFVPGRLKTDDTPVCTKKVPLEISIEGPDSTQALPSLVGPITQIVKVTRLGTPQPDITVTIEQKDFVHNAGQSHSGITNSAGAFSILYVPPYMKSVQIELLAQCEACGNEAQKKISVSESNSQPQACYKNNF